MENGHHPMLGKPFHKFIRYLGDSQLEPELLIDIKSSKFIQKLIPSIDSSLNNLNYTLMIKYSPYLH
jgi:hypothetical protein